MINFSLSFVLVSSVTGWQNEDQAATMGHLHTAADWLEKESSFSTTLSSEGREEINAKCLRITGVAFWTESNGVEVNMSVADISQSVFQETVIPRVHILSHPTKMSGFSGKLGWLRFHHWQLGNQRTSTSPEFWEVPKKPSVADLGTRISSSVMTILFVCKLQDSRSSVSIKCGTTLMWQHSSGLFSLLLCSFSLLQLWFQLCCVFLPPAGTTRSWNTHGYWELHGLPFQTCFSWL